MKRFVAHMLHLANASPPWLKRDREAFYAMKDRILNRWGRIVGQDVQVIERECYRCDGEGKYYDSPCRKCGGSGVYDRFWVYLTRYEFGGYAFHKPTARTWRKPEEPVTIVGHVRHEWPGRSCEEARLWLALAFDRALFARLMSQGGCALGPTWQYPLVTLQKATYRIAGTVRDLKPKRCWCGRTYRRWPWERGGWCVCRRCRGREQERGDDGEIPF